MESLRAPPEDEVIEPWNVIDVTTICDICSKVFSTNYSMTEHRGSVHEGIRFPCDHCDHIASSKRNIRGHINRRHPDKELPVTYNYIKLTEEEMQEYQMNTRSRYDEKDRMSQFVRPKPFKKEVIEEVEEQQFQEEQFEIPEEEEEEVEVTFLCPHCAHTSNFKESLIEHMGSVHPGKPLPTSFMSINEKNQTSLQIIQPRPIVPEIKVIRQRGPLAELEDSEIEMKLDAMTEEARRCLGVSRVRQD